MEKQNLDKKIADFLSGFNKSAKQEKNLETPQPVEEKAEQVQLQEKPSATAPEKSELATDLSTVLPATPAPVIATVVKSPLYYQVEGILAQGLEEAYQKLTPAKQLEFKKVGEATASKIALLLKSAKVRVKEIFNLILKWLKVIPGLNKFFLEQEAKIKADRILALKSKIVKK